MIELIEFAAAFWKKSKNDWQENKHRIFAFFGFILVAFLVLEFGSYIFTRKLNEAKTIELIKIKFLDKQVEISDQCSNKLFSLKEKTRLLLTILNRTPYSKAQCEKLKKEYKLEEALYEFYISSINARYFLGDEIANDMIEFEKQLVQNLNNCFKDLPNTELEMDKKAWSIRNKMWQQVYPLETIKGMVLDT